MPSVAKKPGADTAKGDGALEGNGAAKKRKEPSRQEEVTLSLKIEQRNVTIAHAEQLFKMFTASKSGPDFWGKQEYKKIREFFSDIKSRPNEFHPMMGDILPDGTITEDGIVDINTPVLTTDYVSSIAKYRDLNYANNPVLHVVAVPQLHFENQEG